MTIYYSAITIIVIVLLVIVFSFRWKAKVFDNNVILSAYLDFNQVPDVKLNHNYGSLLFKIQDANSEPKSFIIEKIKFNSAKILLRNFQNLYTNLPVPIEGIVLSVGVMKPEGVYLSEDDNYSVILSGFLMEENEKKTKFKKKLHVRVVPNFNAVNC